jgi:hypothetical protein
VPKGDAIRLTIKGDAIAHDTSWIGGSLASSYPVELVEMTKPKGDQLQVVVRVTSMGALPKAGESVAPKAGGISIPGADLHSATIVSVEPADEHSKVVVSTQTWLTDHEVRVAKVVGSLGLIVLVGLLCKRIHKP